MEAKVKLLAALKPVAIILPSQGVQCLPDQNAKQDL